MAAGAIFTNICMSVGLTCLLGVGSPARAATCEDLVKQTIADTHIVSAVSLPAGFKISSPLARQGVTVAQSFCRVIGFVTPVTGSRVGFEVWLPQPGFWNRKYYSTGNGGWSGAFAYGGIAGPFARGYAVMTTDQGHINDPANPVEDVTWALGHPEAVIDFAYRAEHVASIVGKAIVTNYYGIAPQYAYFSGCSAGGGQGISESLRYPDDYDGYLYGASGPDHLARETGGLWDALAASLADPATAIRPDQLNYVHEAVLKQCAGKDGGMAGDPFLTDPAKCRVNLRKLACKPGMANGRCLSDGQIASFEKIYGGPRNPRTGQSYESGFSAGSEPGWTLFTGKKNPAGAERPWAGFFADIVSGDRDYLGRMKYLQFNFDSDYTAMADKKFSGERLAAAFGADIGRSLDPVRAAGGKIIAYHGWEDGDAPAAASVQMYKEMVAKEARLHHLDHAAALALTRQFYRLFMVPGMGHCREGNGPWNIGQLPYKPVAGNADHDMLTALEKWVELGTPPNRFIGTHVDAQTKAVDMTRPVCPYPAVARWKGIGSTTNAANFICAAAR